MAVIMIGIKVSNFKKNTTLNYVNETYSELKIQRLLKCKKKLDSTNDRNTRQVYITGIFKEFKGFNPGYIRNKKLRKFLINIDNGKTY